MSRERLEVAENLYNKANSDEEYRTVASTAYMAAFQHIMTHEKLGDYQRINTGAEHQNLIEHLKNSTDPIIRKLGYGDLPRLRSLRNKADYEHSVEFTKGLALDALERATEIIYDYFP